MNAPQSPIGLLLIVAGLVVAFIGLLMWLGGLSWLGHLPGDVRIERETFKVYAPFTSMLLLSLVLSLALYLVKRLF